FQSDPDARKSEKPMKTPAHDTRFGEKWWPANWRALSVAWLLCLLPFLPVLLAGQVLVASDQMGAPGVWRWYFEALRNWEIPLWNPYILGGMPTYDAMFGDATYPPFILLGLLLPVTHVVTYNFILHVLIAATGTYLLMRGRFGLAA